MVLHAQELNFTHNFPEYDFYLWFDSNLVEGFPKFFVQNPKNYHFNSLGPRLSKVTASCVTFMQQKLFFKS